MIIFKNEIQKILSLYCNEMNLDSNIDIGVISEMCTDFSGADIKSVVCDALVKAFHRAHNDLSTEDNSEFKSFKHEDNKNILQEKLRSSIKIEENDLISGINTIKQTINKNERLKLKRL